MFRLLGIIMLVGVGVTAMFAGTGMAFMLQHGFSWDIAGITTMFTVVAFWSGVDVGRVIRTNQLTD